MTSYPELYKRFCPKCGSNDIFLASKGSPNDDCFDCGNCGVILPNTELVKCLCKNREAIHTRLENKIIATNYQCLTCGSIHPTPGGKIPMNTPTPWKRAKNPHLKHIATHMNHIEDETGRMVCISGERGNAEAEANTDLIIRAVNYHAALVGALQELVNTAKGLANREHLTKAIEQAERILENVTNEA